MKWMGLLLFVYHCLNAISGCKRSLYISVFSLHILLYKYLEKLLDMIVCECNCFR